MGLFGHGCGCSRDSLEKKADGRDEEIAFVVISLTLIAFTAARFCSEMSRVASEGPICVGESIGAYKFANLNFRKEKPDLSSHKHEWTQFIWFHNDTNSILGSYYL